MDPFLNKLIKALQHFGHHKEAAEVEELAEEPKEFAEPWHEEVTQEFGSEPISEEEYLQQHLETQIDQDLPQRILEKENFHPVNAGSRMSPYLGSGYFGNVFRGVYQGQPAVAKVILYNNDGVLENVQDHGPEFQKWDWIKKMESQMSSHLKSYLPKIYQAKTDSIAESIGKDNKPYGKVQYEIIIMEELYRLPKDMAQMIDGYSKERRNRLNKLLQDEEFLYQIAQNIVTKLGKSFFVRGIQGLNQITPQELFKELYEMGMLVYNSDTMISIQLTSYIQNKLSLAPKDAERVRRVIQNVLSSAFETAIFPRDYDMDPPESKEFTAVWSNLPETSGLLQALQELHKLGLSWKDVKADNLMMNRDGHLKLIDLGLYKIMKAAP